MRPVKTTGPLAIIGTNILVVVINVKQVFIVL